MLSMLGRAIRCVFIIIAYIILFIGYIITADDNMQTFKEWFEKYVPIKD